MMRVGVIYDDSVRPETTGVYCLRALAGMVEAVHLRPDLLHQVAPGEFDWFLRIDDGLRYALPPQLQPCAWWAIDVAWDFPWYVSQADHYEALLCAQRLQATRWAEATGRDVHWLPLACDPEIHQPIPTELAYDVSFVGRLAPGRRMELLSLLQARYPRTFVGQRFFDDMARVYSASRIVFNCALRDDLNMRVFEALSCGSLLVTDDLPESGQAEFFQDGVHLATYRSPEELLAKVDWYLRHDELRQQMAAAGRQAVLAAHTYRHRMQQLLEICGDGFRSRPRSAAGRSRALASGALPIPAEPGAEQSMSSPETAAERIPRRSDDPDYFEHLRPEVLELIPLSAQRILDIGCATGRLGEACRSRQGAGVTGIELDPTAAEIARRRLDRVLVGDICSPQIDFPDGGFDCVVCADVLEHLREPGDVLRRIRRWLTPTGTLLVSLPNVRHHSVVHNLLQGNWTYESAGLLDRDHVRFFTRREIDKLLFRSGFQTETWHAVAGPGDVALRLQMPPGEVRCGNLHLTHLPAAEADEFYTYQYLVRSAPRPLPVRGLTSIILVTRNQWDYTRLCLDSLRLRTDLPYELIVVDNGSTDGTVERLRDRAGIAVIANSENRGFPAAVNQGLAVAQGEQILLLNNDTVVTTGWLERLLDVFARHPDVGLVGPCSNAVSGAQQMAVGYRRLEELDGWAWDYSAGQRGLVEFTDRLVGFCLLGRRAVFDRVGTLDERFGIGCFEDDDLCRRALQAGYRLAIARDAFVHHFGSRTFVGEGLDLRQLLQENQLLFDAKWTAAAAPEDAESPPAPSDPAAPRLSLCMIVRDNEQSLRPCLESVRPWVDELVIVDTGSVDRTPEIAAELGARVFHFPWGDDFAAARNESLRHARGAWIFWMDSDDTLPADCGRRLRELADGAHPESTFGYLMQVHCPGPARAGVQDWTIVDHVKLFRNRPDLRFEGRIHEQILPAIRRAGGAVAWTDIHVVHTYSAQTPAGRARKLERDFRILHKQLAEQPEHPFVLFNLGMTHVDAGEWAEAIPYLQRSIAVAQGEESHLPKAYALLVQSLAGCERIDEALTTCCAALRRWADEPELLFRRALLEQQTGQLAAAAETYRHLLGQQPSRRFRSADPSLTGYKARQNLALVYEEQAQSDLALEQWRTITRDLPGYITGWQGLVDGHCRRGEFSGLEEDFQRLQRDAIPRYPELHSFAHLWRAQIAAAAGDLTAARTEVAQARQLAPADPVLLRAVCRFLFERVSFFEAEEPLRRLVELDPDDAQAAHNLGLICSRSQRPDEARRWFRVAWERDPARSDTAAALEEPWSAADVETSPAPPFVVATP